MYKRQLYELLINVVPPELIMRQLAQELLKKVDDEVKHQVRPPLSTGRVATGPFIVFGGQALIVVDREPVPRAQAWCM